MPAGTRPILKASHLTIKPVTPDTWPDFEALFASRGSPHYCWCMIYRHREAHLMSKEQKQGTMRGLVEAGTPIGLLAYDGDEPVAWCSVAPRETFPKLQRSKAMPTGHEQPAWSVTCFFVKRSHRKSRVTIALLDAAVGYARRNGGAAIEGYPWDTSGNKSRFKGHSTVFASSGFARDGTRWHRSLAGRPRATSKETARA